MTARAKHNRLTKYLEELQAKQYSISNAEGEKDKAPFLFVGFGRAKAPLRYWEMAKCCILDELEIEIFEVKNEIKELDYRPDETGKPESASE